MKKDFNSIDELFKVIQTIETAKAESMSALVTTPELQVNTVTPNQDAFLKDTLGDSYKNIITQFLVFESERKLSVNDAARNRVITDFKNSIEQYFPDKNIQQLELGIAAFKERAPPVLPMPNPISILVCFETLISGTEEIQRKKFNSLHSLIINLLNDLYTRQIAHDYMVKTYYLVEILTGGKQLASEQMKEYSNIYPLIKNFFSMRPIFYRVTLCILLFHGCDDSQRDCVGIETILSMAPDPVVVFIEATASQISEPATKSGDSWIDKDLANPFDSKEIITEKAQPLVQCYNSYVHFFNYPETPKHNLKCIFDSYDSELKIGPRDVLLHIYKNLKVNEQRLFSELLDESMFYIAQNYENNNQQVMNPMLKVFTDAQEKLPFPFVSAGPRVQDFSRLKTFFCPKICSKCVDLSVISGHSLYSDQIACLNDKIQTPSNCLGNCLRKASCQVQKLFARTNAVTARQILDNLISDCNFDPESFKIGVASVNAEIILSVFSGLPCSTVQQQSIIEKFLTALSAAQLRVLQENLVRDSIPETPNGRLAVACFVSGLDVTNSQFIESFSPSIGTVSSTSIIDQASAHHNANQKLYNIVTYRKLMDKDIFKQQLESISIEEKNLITDAGFNAAIHLLSEKSVLYLVDYVDYTAPVISRGLKIHIETQIVKVGHTGSEISFETVLTEGKHSDHPERQVYLDLLLNLIGKGHIDRVGDCARFKLGFDIKQPLRNNYMTSYWKKTFNSMKTGYCGRIINFLDAVIFVLSFLLMIVGLIEVYFHFLHLYQYVLGGKHSGVTVGDANTAARLTSTAGAHGNIGMVKVFLMVMFTVPAVLFGSVKHVIKGDESSSQLVSGMIAGYEVLADSPLCRFIVEAKYDVFKNDLNGDGNNHLLEIVRNRRYSGEFEGRYYQPFLVEIEKFKNDGYLMKTLTQEIWNLAIINLRQKSDPGNDERERLYFQDKLGNPNIIEQTKKFFKKVVQTRKSIWKVTYNRFVYELLQIGIPLGFHLNLEGIKSVRLEQRLESIYEVFGKSHKQVILNEDASKSHQVVAEPTEFNDAKLLRVVQGIFSVFVICAYIVPTSVSLAATITLTHGVAIPVLYVFFFLFPHDFRGIFEGIYDLGFYGAYFMSSRCKDLNFRNTKVLELMLDEFLQIEKSKTMRPYQIYKDATIIDCLNGIKCIRIAGEDHQVVADKAFSFAGNAFTAGTAGLKRHMHMLFPFLKYETLGIAAGVWKTSFLFKILAVPGNYWDKAHLGFSHIAAMFDKQPDWTSGF